MELCVACGRPIPAENGSMLCRHCQLTANCNFMEFKCPECGEPMTVWYQEVVKHRPAAFDRFQYMEVDLIYHCKCGLDWDSTYVSDWGDESQSELTRHYWG